MPQSPLPSDWPRLSVALTYRDPAAAIDWLCRALGFEVRLKIESDAGAIVHSELVLGEALIMVGGEGAPDVGHRLGMGRELRRRLAYDLV